MCPFKLLNQLTSFTKFGMNIMVMKATPTSWISISYRQCKQYDGCIQSTYPA